LSLIKDILHANPRVLRDPAPGFGVARLAESSITISVTPWVNVPDYDVAISEVNKTILETFCARNIVIPLPQYEVRMLGSAA
jgi:small conductance mechanosensitive channel